MLADIQIFSRFIYNDKNNAMVSGLFSDICTLFFVNTLAMVRYLRKLLAPCLHQH